MLLPLKRAAGMRRVLLWALIAVIVSVGAYVAWTNWTAVTQFWNGLRVELQTALISSIATIAAATIAVAIAVYQISRQLRNAVNQNNHSERLKLKISLYKEINATIDQVMMAHLNLSSVMRRFLTEYHTYIVSRELNLNPIIPRVRVEDLIDLSSKADRTFTEILGDLEKWQIVDPNIDIFHLALNVAHDDVQEAYMKYFDIAVKVFPRDRVLESGDKTPFPWTAMKDDVFSEFYKVHELCFERIVTMYSYLGDLQLEIQHLFLGELFPNKIKSRTPLDPEAIVVTIDNHEELRRRFESSNFRKKAKESEVRAREMLAQKR